MGIVETIRQKKGAALGMAVGALVLASLSVIYQFWPQKHFSQNKSYFSDDDGTTWYLDDVDNVPPYQHNGKQAVRATIFSYAHGSKQFCGYLVRYGPLTYKSLQAAIANGAKQTPPKSPQTIMFGPDFCNTPEVKRPGGTNSPWVAIGSAGAQPVLSVKSPDGSELDSVLP